MKQKLLHGYTDQSVACGAFVAFTPSLLIRGWLDGPELVHGIATGVDWPNPGSASGFLGSKGRGSFGDEEAEFLFRGTRRALLSLMRHAMPGTVLEDARFEWLPQDNRA